MLVSHIAQPSIRSLPSLFDTPWLADHIDLILILQHQKYLRLRELKRLHGMVAAARLKEDDETHSQRSRIDQSWSLWITLRYRNLHAKVYRTRLFTPPCIPTICGTLRLPNKKHCLPTRVFWNPMKSQRYKSNNYVLSWWYAYALNGALIFWPRIWSFVMLISLGMSFRSPTPWLYKNSWMNTARIGASASTTTFIRLLWFRGLLRHLFFDFNVTKSAKESSSLEQLMHHNEQKEHVLSVDCPGLNNSFLLRDWRFCSEFCSESISVNLLPLIHILIDLSEIWLRCAHVSPLHHARHRSYLYCP